MTTYFIGQCKIRFANIYRSWLEKEIGSALPVDPTAADPRMDAPTAAIGSPEWKAVARGYIRRGTRAVRDPRIHRALELIAADHTQAVAGGRYSITTKGTKHGRGRHPHQRGRHPHQQAGRPLGETAQHLPPQPRPQEPEGLILNRSRADRGH